MDKEGLRSKLQVYTDETSKLAPEKQPCVILVGTKRDLREAEKGPGQGWDLAQALGAQEYLECSAVLSHADVKELFKKVINILGGTTDSEVRGKNPIYGLSSKQIPIF